MDQTRSLRPSVRRVMLRDDRDTEDLLALATEIRCPVHIAQSSGSLEPRRLLDAYEATAPEPLTPDEHRWLPGALALVPLHWAATAGLVGRSVHEAESTMTTAEAWWSR